MRTICKKCGIEKESKEFLDHHHNPQDGICMICKETPEVFTGSQSNKRDNDELGVLPVYPEAVDETPVKEPEVTKTDKPVVNKKSQNRK